MHSRWQTALATAEVHDGLLTLERMRSLGLNDRQIDGARADGLIVWVAPEVYRVRGVPQTERMAVAAAVLSTKGDASHGAAASLLRMEARSPVVLIDVRVEAVARQPRLERVEIETVRRSFHPVSVHRFTDHAEPVMTVDGIRCTDAARTLIDLAGRLSVDQLDDAYERARRLELVSPESLARRFEVLGGRGRKGSAKIRQVLAGTQAGVLDSKLEARVGRMMRRARLDVSVRQFRINLPRGKWYRVDFARPDLLLAIEAEGFEWHGSRAQWKADRLRVAALERLGWRIVIVTWDDVTKRRAETVDRIAMALAERTRLLKLASSMTDVRRAAGEVVERTSVGGGAVVSR